MSQGRVTQHVFTWELSTNSGSDGLSYLASKSCARSFSNVYNHRLCHAVGT